MTEKLNGKQEASIKGEELSEKTAPNNSDKEDVQQFGSGRYEGLRN